MFFQFCLRSPVRSVPSQGKGRTVLRPTAAATGQTSAKQANSRQSGEMSRSGAGNDRCAVAMQYRPGVVASAHPGGAVTATILSVGAIRTCSIRSASNASEGTMPNERERFLETVRRAVAAGNQAGAAPPLPERGQVGY